MLGVAAVHIGLLTGFLGAMFCLMPPRRLGIHTRGEAAIVVAVGVAIALSGVLLPAPEIRVQTPRTHLDRFVPVYEFHERHSIRVAASKENVYAAIKSVSADEIALFQAMTWIRRGGRPGEEGILNAPGHEPILDVATRTTFLLLAEEPGHEIVIGMPVIAPRGWRRREKPTPEDFQAVREPGFALAAMNFLLEDSGDGSCVVTTETRIHATDASARRRFAAYWRIIYPGSSLLRYTWLGAIKRRAESS